MAWSGILASFIAGLLGGVHCLAMCGGFVAALSSRGAGVVPLRKASELAWAQLPSNVGRIATYVVLGALAGGVGGTLIGASLLPVQRGLFVAANVALLALAWLVATRTEAFTWMQAAGARVFSRLAPAIGPLSRREGVTARFALGSIWGLVPCGMIYSVLPIALFAGDAVQGALVMLAFGLGTLPNLLAAGWLVARARGRLARPAVRWAMACVLVTFAVLGIWRALNGDPGALAQGPFCLVH